MTSATRKKRRRKVKFIPANFFLTLKKENCFFFPRRQRRSSDVVISNLTYAKNLVYSYSVVQAFFCDGNAFQNWVVFRPTAANYQMAKLKRERGAAQEIVVFSCPIVDAPARLLDSAYTCSASSSSDMCTTGCVYVRRASVAVVSGVAQSGWQADLR